MVFNGLLPLQRIQARFYLEIYIVAFLEKRGENALIGICSYYINKTKFNGLEIIWGETCPLGGGGGGDNIPCFPTIATTHSMY